MNLYAQDPAKAKKYVTDLHMQISEKACKDADYLYDDLLFFMMDRFGRTTKKLGEPFVPEIQLRYAEKAKGYTLEWNGNKEPIVLTKGSSSYKFMIGDDTCMVTKDGNTTEVKLTFSPLLENGTVYIPLDLAMTF